MTLKNRLLIFSQNFSAILLFLTIVVVLKEYIPITLQDAGSELNEKIRSRRVTHIMVIPLSSIATLD